MTTLPTPCDCPRYELLRREIGTTEEAKQWIVDLHAKGLMFHFEDSPATITDNATGRMLFDVVECLELRLRLDELYDPQLSWGEYECPIGFALAVMDAAGELPASYKDQMV